MKIRKDVINKILLHSRKDMPYEACGYLASRDGITVRNYELTNTDKSPEHFSFDPKEQFAVMKDARGRQLELRAVYHSHPDTPARPSEEDINLAHDPGIIYVIVSLACGREDIKAFKIINNSVIPEPVEVINNEI